MKHSSLQLATALWLAATHFALAQTVTIGKPPMDNPLSVINFSPATLPSQDMRNPNTYIPEAQSAALLDSLLPYVKGVRTFETQKGLELVPKLAKDRGLKVVMGIWIGQNKATNEAQIANAIAIINAGHADTVIVGSEVLLRCDQPADTLVKYINRLQAVCDPLGIPVSCADVYSYLMAYPQVMAACDFVAVNIYPWWESVSIEDAMCRFNKAYECLKAKANGKPIFISESGWKTANDNNGAAIASLPNAASYHVRMRHWSLATGIEVNPFSAFDEPWKGTHDDGWGLFTKDAVLKQGMDSLFQPITAVDTTSWACPWPSVTGQPGVFIDHLPVINSQEFLEGHVTGVRPCFYKVAIYIKVPNWGWVSKPTYCMPFAFIGYGGYWSADYVTGGTDYLATDICAFLVPIDYKVPIVSPAANLPAAIFQNSIASTCYHRYELPQAMAVAAPDTICPGGSTVITASGGAHYKWETGDTTAQINVAPSSSRFYQVTITDGLPGGGSVAKAYVLVKSVSGLVKAYPSTICKGQTSMLVASGGVIYQWPDGETNDTIYVSPDTTTIYSVTVTGANGCTDEASVQVSVSLPVVSISTSPSPASICSGSSILLSANSSMSYNWSTGATSKSISVKPEKDSTFYVTITNSYNCTAVGSIFVDVRPSLPPFIIQPDSLISVCKNAPFTLSAPFDSSYTYKWSPGGETTASITKSITLTTSFRVSVTNAGDCTTASPNKTVTAFNLPTATLTATPSSLPCPGQLVSLKAGGGGTYLHSNGSTAATTQAQPLETTTYTVTVTAANGCTDTELVTVNVPLPVTATISGSGQVCANGGTAELLVNLGGSPPFTFWWQANGSAPVAVNTSDTLYVLQVGPSVNTTYQLTAVNNAQCSGTVSGQATVAVAAPPAAEMQPVGQSFCGKAQTAIEVKLSGNGPFTLGWSVNGIPQPPVQVAGPLFHIPVEVSATTTFALTEFTANGCVGTVSGSAVVFVKPLPVANIEGQPNFSAQICAGGAVLLTASGGDACIWSTGATSCAITESPSATQTYWVAVATAGCTDTAEALVTVNPPPTVSIMGADTLALGDSTMLTACCADSFIWDNGATGTQITVKPDSTATYSVTGTDANGCEAVAAWTVNVTTTETGSPIAGRPGLDWSAWPNPFGDVLFVEFFLLERADISIELFDLKGAVSWRPIHQLSVEAGQHLYDLSLPDGLPTGAYRAVIRVDGYPFIKLLLKG